MKRYLMMTAVISILSLTGSAFAETDFYIYPNYAVLGTFADFANYEHTESKVRQYPVQFFELNRRSMADGAVLANVLGYPEGKPLIGEFPHMEIGFTAGASASQYDKYQDFNRNYLSVPGAGLNAALHIGTGVTPDSDLTFKLMLDPGYTFYSVKKVHDDYSYEWKKLEIVSTGLKWRTYLLHGQDDPSWLASFRGITLSVAGDYMHLKVTADGTYQADREFSFTISDPADPSTSQKTKVPVTTTVKGSTSIGWDIASVTPQILVHSNLLYVFNFYTGPSVSLNAGKVYVMSHSSGQMKNKADVYEPSNTTIIIPANSVIGTADMRISEAVSVTPVVPRWILGMEFDFWAVKLQVEASDVLTSPADSFTAQFGMRTQF